MILIIALHLFYGASLPINKFLLSLCPPIFFSGVRMVIAGLLFLGGTFFFYAKKWQLKRDLFWLYFQSAFFGVYCKYILRNWSLAHLPAAKMAFLLGAAPFVSALFSYYYFGQVHSKKQWIGLSIGLLGLIPIIILKAPSEKITEQFFSISLPELVSFIAMVCHINGMIVVKKLIQKKVSSVMINGVQMFVGGFFALLTGIFFEGYFPISNVAVFARWLLLLIILSNFVCHTLYVKLLKWYSVTFVSLTDSLNYLVVAFYSWFFLKEQISWHYGLSAVFLFLGLYLFYQDELSFQKFSICASC